MIKGHPEKREIHHFDAGCGSTPMCLIKKALRRKKITFTGVDQKIFAVTGEKLPENLKLEKQCAILRLKEAPPESLDLISESYLLGNLEPYSCVGPHGTCEENFFHHAVNALKPNGKIVIVQDKWQTPHYRKIAKQYGLSFRAFTIPDSLAEKSPSESVRERSSPEKRDSMMKYYSNGDHGWRNDNRVTTLIQQGVIKSPDDFARPTIFIMRKQNSEK